MSAVILKAHYDGKDIVLDEPFDLPANCSLQVVVLPDATQVEEERAEWNTLAAQSLARAYGPNEPEYTLADLKRTP
jgi:hypothetical protein